ncbi:MAG: DUF1028 domain-containing protein [Spirochaetes bacterium]|jgi:uncharacterized Ntn-hydrolase superfamily protein|nr:DUF1028 domain-containing protein [Spirochaetota bacterium]
MKPSSYAHTYSIIAIDAEAGEMGAAVQSHYFSVGSIVPWARAGVGVVATQALVNAQFGPDGLALLEAGHSPREALAKLLEADEGRAYRQVALLAPGQAPATHTGETCIAEAGHVTSTDYSCQANMMLNDTVWEAMSQAFDAENGPLSHRMLTALKAAEYEGGDIRGRQSAAMVIVRTEATGRAVDDRVLDLRVEDHHNPLTELERLLAVHQAYRHADAGDAAMETGDIRRALEEFRTAEDLQPDNLELHYWHGVSLLNAGRIDEGLAILGEVVSRNRNWLELTLRLPDAGLADFDEKTLGRLREL